MAVPIQGNNLTLWKQDAILGMIPFAASRTCTLQVNLGLKEVTNYASANWQEYKEDLMNWSLTNEGLIFDTEYSYVLLLRDQKTRTKYFFQFIVDEGSAGFYIISGYCYITNVSISGPQKDVAIVNATLQGTGSYTVTSTPIAMSTLTNTTSATPSGGLTTFNVAALNGATVCLYASRGGIDVQNILTSGTPTNDDIVVDVTTGNVTVAAASPTMVGEFWRFLYR
jgi:predicted secreted protein